LSYEDAKLAMEKKGIYVESGSKKGLVEEAPSSYKDIHEVVRVSHEIGIGKKIARLDPLLVVIG
jgi:tRNA-splicing ligase RtcB